MDMYKKRELRAKKKQEDSSNNKSFASSSINWVAGIYGRTALKSVFI